MAPGLVLVVIVRGFEGEVCDCVVDEVCEGCDEDAEEALPCCMAEWARKAARKFERKGRLVGMVVDVLGSWLGIVCYIKGRWKCSLPRQEVLFDPLLS